MSKSVEGDSAATILVTSGDMAKFADRIGQFDEAQMKVLRDEFVGMLDGKVRDLKKELEAHAEIKARSTVRNWIGVPAIILSTVVGVFLAVPGMTEGLIAHYVLSEPDRFIAALLDDEEKAKKVADSLLLGFSLKSSGEPAAINDYFVENLTKLDLKDKSLENISYSSLGGSIVDSIKLAAEEVAQRETLQDVLLDNRAALQLQERFKSIRLFADAKSDHEVLTTLKCIEKTAIGKVRVTIVDPKLSSRSRYGQKIDHTQPQAILALPDMNQSYPPLLDILPPDSPARFRISIAISRSPEVVSNDEGQLLQLVSIEQYSTKEREKLINEQSKKLTTPLDVPVTWDAELRVTKAAQERFKLKSGELVYLHFEFGGEV